MGHLTYLIFVITFNLIACPFTNEDFFVVLCEADETHMKDVWTMCADVVRDAVDGCLQMCYISMRNARAPTLRIDEKYYQFVMCDNDLWTEFLGCSGPCLEQLQVSYNAVDNINEWANCITDAVREMKDEIEHQGDPDYRPKPKGPNNHKRIGRPKTEVSGSRRTNAVSTTKKKRMMIKLNKN